MDVDSSSTARLVFWSEQCRQEDHDGGNDAGNEQTDCAAWQPVTEEEAAEQRCPHRVERDEEHRPRRVIGEKGEREAKLVANL